MPAVVAGVLAAENAPSTAAPAVVAGAGDAFSKAGNTEAEHTELDAEAGGGPDASAQMIVGAEAGEVPAASTTAGTVGFSTRGVSTGENVGAGTATGGCEASPEAATPSVVDAHGGASTSDTT